MRTHRPSGFLQVVGLHPYRFSLGAFFLILSFVSGVSSSLLCHDPARMLLFAPVAPARGGYALGSAIAAQGLFTCAVFYGKRGGLRVLSACAAFFLEGFSGGFALSELLFRYGARLMPLLLLFTACCGAAGAVLRLYCFVREEGGLRAYAPVWQGLILLTLAQGAFLPLLLGMGAD